MKTEFQKQHMLKLLKYMTRENMICWLVIFVLFLVITILNSLLIRKIVVRQFYIYKYIHLG